MRGSHRYESCRGARRFRLSCGAVAFRLVLLTLFAVEPIFGTEEPAYGRAAAAAIPDDAALREQIDEAIELRRREDFDRFLDARDPGELIEHATLTEVDFRHRHLGNDTLFVVGDELFGILLRPENGWGGAYPGRGESYYQPVLRRVHSGGAGGPDAFACFSCHSKGGPDGAGMQTQNAYFTGDGERLGTADQRNPPHLLGLGPIAVLAREMTAELQAEAAAVVREAGESGARATRALSAKGVSFGVIAADANGDIDVTGLVGVDGDLVVRPFGWKGHQATLLDMIEESLHLHQGLVSMRIQQAVRDGRLDTAAYGSGERWFDVDGDGVNLEADSGMLATMEGYLVQLEVPITRLPSDPGLLDAFAAGRARFDAIGCAACHVPTLEIGNAIYEVRPVADLPPFVIDIAKDGESPKVEPKYASAVTPYLVHLFSDLKRHDMGPDLASPAPQRGIPASVFLTRPLWGLAETAPYLHDGRAPTVHEAIALHGGEGAESRDAYLALAEPARAALRVFLMSLSREPKLLLP